MISAHAVRSVLYPMILSSLSQLAHTHIVKTLSISFLFSMQFLRVKAANCSWKILCRWTSFVVRVFYFWFFLVFQSHGLHLLAVHLVWFPIFALSIRPCVSDYGGVQAVCHLTSLASLNELEHVSDGLSSYVLNQWENTFSVVLIVFCQ